MRWPRAEAAVEQWSRGHAYSGVEQRGRGGAPGEGGSTASKMERRRVLPWPNFDGGGRRPWRQWRTRRASGAWVMGWGGPRGSGEVGGDDERVSGQALYRSGKELHDGDRGFEMAVAVAALRRSTETVRSYGTRGRGIWMVRECTGKPYDACGQARARWRGAPDNTIA